MTNPKTRMAQCEGKRKRTQPNAAKAAAGLNCDAYKCPHCNHWHIGNKRGPTIFDDDDTRPRRFM